MRLAMRIINRVVDIVNGIRTEIRKLAGTASVFDLPVLHNLSLTYPVGKVQIELPTDFVLSFHNQLGTVWTVHSLNGKTRRLEYIENAVTGDWGAIVGGWPEFTRTFNLNDGETVTLKFLGMSRFQVDLNEVNDEANGGGNNDNEDEGTEKGVKRD
ncbi:hypothetical protein RIF29_03310 [Crotalaria pallida]|uniref:TF-B3 domain-containing protein n=1 Tax=Crotalaria pallida TaxID=3830 RepID=A0AAN9J0J4_CROPI